MALNLWNELKASVTGDTVDRIAVTTGESAEATRRGLLGGALPAVLAGVTERFSGEAGATRLLDEARAADPDGSMLDDLTGGRAGGADVTHRVGQGFLGSLFGPRTDTVADVVAGHAGIRKSSALSLLAVAGPLLLGFLSRRARTGGLDAGQLSASLRELRGQIPGIAPPGLTSALGIRGEEPRHHHEAPMAVAAAGRPKWLPWVIAALAVLALLALMRTCRKAAEPTPVAPVTHPAPVTTPVAPVTPAAAPVAINLPDGTTLNLQPDSLTHGLAVYLADPAGAPPPRRFTFKNLNFDTASNAIDAASQTTVNDLAAILKAYPNTVVAIEGHTDNVGEPAANLELSKRRAEAVRDALYAKGIAKERVSGVGYGETKPMAPNDTEAGRAQNRRTDLVVTKK